MSVTNIHAAKTNLSKLIDAALRGEEVVIAKSGKPLVKIVAIEPAPAEFDRKALIGAWTGRAARLGWDEWKHKAAGMDESFGAIDELARRLAGVVSDDVETAVQMALEERLARMASPPRGGRNAALNAFFARLSEMPVKDARPIDEIVGYGGDGLPL